MFKSKYELRMEELEAIQQGYAQKAQIEALRISVIHLQSELRKLGKSFEDVKKALKEG